MALTQLTGAGLMTMAPATGVGVPPVSGVAVAPGVTPVAGVVPQQPTVSFPLGSVPAPGAVLQPAVAQAQIASAAEAAINAALGVPSAQTATTATASSPVASEPDPKKIIGAESPTKQIIVHNMFDKDEETEEGWEEEIRQDFEEESSKYGKIQSVIVMSKEPGGKIYASFQTVDGAKSCAENLAGRWFDKRQLRVEFVSDEALPAT